MPYFVLKKECANNIYDNKDFEVEILEFKTKELAENYLEGKKSTKTDKHIKVFTDGACSNNGKPTAKAGIGVYFSEGDKRNVSKRIHGKQSNNTAELSAIIEVFNILKEEIDNGCKITIYTDSEYSIKCCGNYGLKCSQKNWKNNKGLIPNHQLVKEAYEKKSKYSNVSLEYIKAHTGLVDELSLGNDGADKLANLSIQNYKPRLDESKVYLNCPFNKKDSAKELGAKWDNNKKSWYYEKNNISKINADKLSEMFT